MKFYVSTPESVMAENMRLFSSRAKEFKGTKEFVVNFHYLGWSCFSLGVHIDIKNLNIEIHLPCGFLRIGMYTSYEPSPDKEFCPCGNPATGDYGICSDPKCK